MNPIFIVKLFENPEDSTDQKRSQGCLLLMLEALTNCNQLWLKTHPDTPLIYKAPIRYEREYGTEEWCDIPTILEKGYGDCEDLACYRVAELRHTGHKASPYVKYKKIDGKYHYHALVKRAGINPKTGKYGAWLEDPSKRLGMGREQDFAKEMLAKGIKPRSVFDTQPNYIAGLYADNTFGGMGYKPLGRFFGIKPDRR